MYAVIEAGGKQYKVCVEDVIKVEKLEAEVGAEVSFPVLLVAEGEAVKAGKEVEGTQCKATVLEHGKNKKIVVFKYKPKKNIRKKTGHRQQYTQVKIQSIG